MIVRYLYMYKYIILYNLYLNHRTSRYKPTHMTGVLMLKVHVIYKLDLDIHVVSSADSTLEEEKVCSVSYRTMAFEMTMLGSWCHLGWESNTKYSSGSKSWGGKLELWGGKSQGTPPSVWNTGLVTLGKKLGPVDDPWRSLLVPIRSQL